MQKNNNSFMYSRSGIWTCHPVARYRWLLHIGGSYLFKWHLVRVLVEDFHFVSEVLRVLAPALDEGRVGRRGAWLVPRVDPELEKIGQLAVLQKGLHQVVSWRKSKPVHDRGDSIVVSMFLLNMPILASFSSVFVSGQTNKHTTIAIWNLRVTHWTLF